MATASFNLSELNGSNGFVINGIDEGDFSGGSVSGAGDINGDRIDDLIIGATRADPNGNSSAGETYVVFGKSGGFDASLNLSQLNGSNGFVLNGIDEVDFSGSSVSDAGDINGDGIDDLIIGATRADPNGNSSAGETYIVFGKSGSFDASLNLSELNGSNGFVINGIDFYDVSGFSVSGAGDINGDGFDDLIIGAPVVDTTEVFYDPPSGESYVVFGQAEGFGASLNLSDLNGSNGFIISGINSADLLGISVSGAGDINDDGIDDLIIGADDADPNGNEGAGETYIVFGNEEGFDATLNLSQLDGSNGFVLNGIDERDFSGGSVSGAGDINGDGIDDLIIGANGADPNGNSRAGETYVVFANSEGFNASLELSELNGSNGFVLNGIDELDNSGVSVSGAGDINGDGIDDLIISAWNADPNGNSRAGETYVVFGNSEGFNASLELSELNGSNGFVINGIDPDDLSGFSVSGAGDINGDGVDDLIIGAPGADPNDTPGAGETYCGLR
nr:MULTISPECIES: integrin alpha [unclassified Coleofasciculus]